MASARGADVEEGKTTPTPPVDWRARNPLKQLFFAQVSPLIAEGTVRRLEPTDLCHLDALDSQRVRARAKKTTKRRDEGRGWAAVEHERVLCVIIARVDVATRA